MMEKREHILNTVLSFLSHSDREDSLTIANVARALNMGKSTIYEYFDSKDDMIQSAFELMLQQNRAAILNDEELKTLTFKKAFINHMNRGLELAKKNVFIRDFTHHPDILKLPKKTKEAMFNAVQENNEYLEKAMRKIFEKGRNEGVLENRIKEERFRTIEAMIFGMMIAMNTPFSNWDRRTQIEDIYEAIVTLVNA
jgi:AcrR family transcriptional regulator